MTARAQLESLLRARKLDVTLMNAALWRTDRASTADLASVGVLSIDASLGGGLRRGHLSEIVGGRSSGRTTVVCQAMSAAVSRGELVAMVDTCDRFDPVSASEAGLDLSRLLWIRDTGDASRSLKAMNLVLQAGGFGLLLPRILLQHQVAVGNRIGDARRQFRIPRLEFDDDDAQGTAHQTPHR